MHVYVTLYVCLLGCDWRKEGDTELRTAIFHARMPYGELLRIKQLLITSSAVMIRYLVASKDKKTFQVKSTDQGHEVT